MLLSMMLQRVSHNLVTEQQQQQQFSIQTPENTLISLEWEEIQA